MQTKTSYRVVVKWIFLGGMLASLASACVVSSGDGIKDDNEGGDGGTESSGGTPSAGTGGSSAGTGGSSAGTGGSSAGTSAQGGDGGTGTTDPEYVPGLCEDDLPTPSVQPSCAPSDNDAGNDCKICMKASCCVEWQGCFGSEPTIACGWGETEDADGQFDCTRKCFEDGVEDATDPDELLADCAFACVNQCDAADNGLPMEATSDLIACAVADCNSQCFPFE